MTCLAADVPSHSPEGIPRRSHLLLFLPPREDDTPTAPSPQLPPQVSYPGDLGRALGLVPCNPGRDVRLRILVAGSLSKTECHHAPPAKFVIFTLDVDRLEGRRARGAGVSQELAGAGGDGAVEGTTSRVVDQLVSADEVVTVARAHRECCGALAWMQGKGMVLVVLQSRVSVRKNGVTYA